MKNNVRSVACEIAKVLGKQNGTAPNKQLSEAWKLAKAGKTPEDLKTEETKFFRVTYKGVKGNYKNSIVPAKSEVEARKKFYDEEDPIGPKNTVIRVAKPRKIPQDWVIVVEREGEYLSIPLDRELVASPSVECSTVVGGKEYKFNLKDIIAVNPPRKEAVL